MAQITPTTELEAVNYLLEAIEEEAVNTLVNAADPDVQAARGYIQRNLRALQVPGWEFNREEEFKLNPNLNDEIDISPNIIKVTVPGENYAIRASKLYDRKKKTYTFTEEVSAEVILLLNFEELPEAARVYVVVASAFEFQAKRAPDELIARLTRQDVQDAWDEFVADDMRSGNFSFSGLQNIQNRTR